MYPRTPKKIDSTRIFRPIEETDTFREGPVYTVSVNGSDDLEPQHKFSAVAGWLYTEWSQVSVNNPLFLCPIPSLRIKFWVLKLHSYF